MPKTSAILLLMVLTFGGVTRAAQQAKPNVAAKPPSACSLVTRAEIEQAIGTTIGNGVTHEAGEADVCAYANSKGNKVNIFVSRSQNKRDFSALVGQAKEALPNAKVREFQGLGERALLVEDPNGPTILSVYRGGDALVVSVYGIPNGPKAEAAVEKIARKAYKRF